MLFIDSWTETVQSLDNQFEIHFSNVRHMDKTISAYRSWRAFVAQAGNRAGEFWVAKVSQRAFVALAADLAGEFLVAKVCLGEFWETCSLAKVCLEFCQDEHYYHSHTFALKVQRIVALLCLIFGEN